MEGGREGERNKGRYSSLNTRTQVLVSKLGQNAQG